MKIEILTAEEWSEISKEAMRVSFGIDHNPMDDRIDYAAIGINDKNTIVGFIVVHEMDKVCAYWKFGGALPNISGTLEVFRWYNSFVEWSKNKGYKHIFTRIENNNLPMLKLAMKVGFRIIGVRIRDGIIMLEHELVIGEK